MRHRAMVLAAIQPLPLYKKSRFRNTSVFRIRMFCIVMPGLWLSQIVFFQRTEPVSQPSRLFVSLFGNGFLELLRQFLL